MNFNTDLDEDLIELDIFRNHLGLSYDEFEDYFENTDFEIFLEEKNKALSYHLSESQDEHLEDDNHIFEFEFDAHGNYMDDDYFFKRDYEGKFCSLYPEDEEEVF